MASVPHGGDEILFYVLNGLGFNYKEIAAAIRARDTPLTFAELHDKLANYGDFVKCNSPSISDISGPVTAHFANRLASSSRCSSSYNYNGRQPYSSYGSHSRPQPLDSNSGPYSSPIGTTITILDLVLFVNFAPFQGMMHKGAGNSLLLSHGSLLASNLHHLYLGPILMHVHHLVLFYVPTLQHRLLHHPLPGLLILELLTMLPRI